MLREGELTTIDARARFRTEAEATAALEHPQIVPVYEVGEHDGAMYLAMKLMPGGDLAERRAEERPAPATSAGWVRDIARAVAYAHRRGILHRDLKPGNILFDDQGRPHLSDFGLSKFLDADAGLTRSYGVLGTPSYTAPEVAQGGARSATTAADVWGLGAVLYEALSGHPPFVGESVHEVLRRVAEEEVAPWTRPISVGDTFNLRPVGPKLKLKVKADGLDLCWPAAEAEGYALEFHEELGPSTGWRWVDAPVTMQNGTNSVSLPLMRRVGFYRLRRL